MKLVVMEDRKEGPGLSMSLYNAPCSVIYRRVRHTRKLKNLGEHEANSMQKLNISNINRWTAWVPTSSTTRSDPSPAQQPVPLIEDQWKLRTARAWNS